MREEKRISDSIILLNAEYVDLTEEIFEILPKFRERKGIKITYECCLGYKLTTLTITFPTKDHIKLWLKKNNINIRRYPKILKILQKNDVA